LACYLRALAATESRTMYALIGLSASPSINFKRHIVHCARSLCDIAAVIANSGNLHPFLWESRCRITAICIFDVMMANGSSQKVEIRDWLA
jgi:hypothetical protein